MLNKPCDLNLHNKKSMSYGIFGRLIAFFRPIHVAEGSVTGKAKLIVLHSLGEILLAIRTLMMFGLVSEFVAPVHVRCDLRAVFALAVVIN